jgi:competence protein ComEA
VVVGVLAALLLAQSFPEGPGKDTFELICSFCHPPAFVLDQTFSRPEWQTKVAEMLQGADVTQQEKDAIVSYLAKNFPKKVKVNEAAAKELQEVLQITEAQAAAVVASRRANGALKSVDDLKRVTGIDDSKFEDIRNRILF